MVYLGVLFGRLAATLGLVSASAGSAVWLGVSSPDARCWLQAGLEGNPAYAYVERGCAGRQVSFRSWLVPADHLAWVRLERRGAYWRIRIDGYCSRWWLVRRAVSITALETRSRAAALIDGRLVVGP